MYNDQFKLESLILEEVKRRQNVPQILFLFSYRNNLIKRILIETQAAITVVATDEDVTSNERIDKWTEDPFKFIDLAIETKTQFDLILLINPEEYFYNRDGLDFEEIHKELFRDMQRTLLKQSGIIMFSTHKKGFKLDQYIKPGADKLTKQVLTKEERESSSLQAYAFYT